MTARRGTGRRATLAIAVTLGIGGPASGATAAEPAPRTAAADLVARATIASTDPAPAPPARRGGRLDAAAATLRRDPLHLDDELGWMLDADEAASLRRDLRKARVPVLVAILPALTEDESGGDSRRVLQTLQRKVGRDAVYVTADDRGQLDVASVGIPLDLRIPLSLTFPPRDERPYEEQAEDPGPAGYTSVPDRLRQILRYVRVAEPGTPNGIVDDVRPLRDLPGHHAPADSPQDIVAIGIVGLFLGLTVSSLALVGRRAQQRRLLARASTDQGRRSRRA